jgi:Matrixin
MLVAVVRVSAGTPPTMITASGRLPGSVTASTGQPRPPELDPDAAAGAINAGGTNITSVRNNCRFADADGVPAEAELTYLGDTNATADIDREECTRTSDGNNVVSFGDLTRGVLAVAFTRFTFIPSEPDYGEVVEADIKVNKADFKWTVNPGSRSCRNRHDLQSVMTHERGHNFGLGHVSQKRHASLTMSPLIRACQSSDRTLGRGDVLGLNRKYREP